MAKLSVNVNKVATLRISRGGREPNLIEAVHVCIAAGAPGITVHPRADRRHITPEDVRAVAQFTRPVTLAEIKGRKDLSEMALVRIGRLSVTPVRAAEWDTICALAS